MQLMPATVTGKEHQIKRCMPWGRVAKATRSIMSVQFLFIRRYWWESGPKSYDMQS